MLALCLPVVSCGADEDPEPILELASCEDWIEPVVKTCCEAKRDLIICDPDAVAALGPDDGRVIEYNAFFSGFSSDCHAVARTCGSGDQVSCQGEVVGGQCRYQCKTSCD